MVPSYLKNISEYDARWPGGWVIRNKYLTKPGYSVIYTGIKRYITISQK